MIGKDCVALEDSEGLIACVRNSDLGNVVLGTRHLNRNGANGKSCASECYDREGIKKHGEIAEYQTRE